MWNHFIEFCTENYNLVFESLHDPFIIDIVDSYASIGGESLAKVTNKADWTQLPYFQRSTCPFSRHLSDHKRLPVFISLSCTEKKFLSIDILSTKKHPLSPDSSTTSESNGSTDINSYSSPGGYPLFSPSPSDTVAFFPSPPSLIPIRKAQVPSV